MPIAKWRTFCLDLNVLKIHRRNNSNHGVITDLTFLGGVCRERTYNIISKCDDYELKAMIENKKLLSR